MIASLPKDELWTRPFHILEGETKSDFLVRTHQIEILRRACKTRASTEVENIFMARLLVGNATRIDVDDDQDLHFWMAKFGVTEQKLRDAVRANGTVFTHVQHFLS